MPAIEFTTELSDSRMLSIPQKVAAQLPKTGRARVLVLTDEVTGDTAKIPMCMTGANRRDSSHGTKFRRRPI